VTFTFPLTLSVQAKKRMCPIKFRPLQVFLDLEAK
jgi:hypothetical protein